MSDFDGIHTMWKFDYAPTPSICSRCGGPSVIMYKGGHWCAACNRADSPESHSICSSCHVVDMGKFCITCDTGFGEWANTVFGDMPGCHENIGDIMHMTYMWLPYVPDKNYDYKLRYHSKGEWPGFYMGGERWTHIDPSSIKISDSQMKEWHEWNRKWNILTTRFKNEPDHKIDQMCDIAMAILRGNGIHIDREIQYSMPA